jgi:small redox-active disulfide protein 2
MRPISGAADRAIASQSGGNSMVIKVLGPGCANCGRLATLADEVTREMGVKATVEKVTDIREIMAYRVLATPGLVIDSKLVCAGRVPAKPEVTTWVANALMAAGARAREP